MWHSHMNLPLIYKNVTQILLGSVLNHDDSVNDRSEGSALNFSYSKTRQLWKAEYDEHFSTYGAMFRGIPPNGRLLNQSEMTNLISKVVQVTLKRVQIMGSGSDHLGKFKLVFLEKNQFWSTLNAYGKKTLVDLSDELLVLKGPNLIWEDAGSFDKSVHCMDYHELHVQLKETHSVFFMKKKHLVLGDCNIAIDKLAYKLKNGQTEIQEQLTLGLDTNLQLRLDMKVTLKQLGSVELQLVPGKYEDCVMPEDAAQLWGPIVLPHLPTGVVNTCSVASHRLRGHDGQTEFTCRVVHSLPLLMSAVQIFQHDRMVAVAHLIGSDQIPKPDEVSC
ncbi:hypothetical protein DPMN_007435 [Dreissena polymorpha]|uniref:Uncharacterized protein n=1 Tax=Dreissena polymorpha TaxID=45954 RepID=A0A9D4MW77_DREPO|nr:hypothetical protein DPMN_007435 [Dreissena polymorpha]